MSLNRLKIWLSAFRLRTLPLALSCVFMGAALSFSLGKFNTSIFALTVITTVLLQILSNLANDYGDGIKGTDNEHRIGPKRAVQSGEISLSSMKIALIVNVICCLLSGVLLLYLAFGAAQLLIFLFFLVLGIFAIAAAIKYTIGENAYGYSGLGDAAVFIFFGLIGVMGSNFLFTMTWHWLHLLPAISIGLLSIGVLNLNNMRDIENDKSSKKNTIPVKLGLSRAKQYHYFLILVAILSLIAYRCFAFQSIFQLLFLLVFPLLLRHLIAVKKCVQHKDFNPMLPQLAISTFLISFLFFIGEYLTKVYS